ncbi:MAG: hypothetical protein ABIP95_07365 [Pelobium sp.]
MIETSTPTTNSICNNETEIEEMNFKLSKEEIAFYESIQPALNKLVKQPSEQAIENILKFSKSL